MKPSWDQLSAYVDGELEAGQAAGVAAAIAADPDLAASVATLTRLKATAAEAGPVWDEAAIAVLPPGRGKAVAWRPALIAASLVLAVGLGAAALIMQQHNGGSAPASLQAAVDLHRNWITEPASAVRPDRAAATAALTEIPDLSAAGLMLSHVAASAPLAGQGKGMLFGFRGPRGCRVSLWVSEAPESFTPMPTLQDVDGLAAFIWRVGHKGYVLLTRDMDPQRFATLASAVARITREQFRVDDLTRMALQQSADPALPCPV